jgi:hypothetical protein
MGVVLVDDITAPANIEGATKRARIEFSFRISIEF